MTEGRRPRRVADTIRSYVAEALTRELFDPRLEGVTITRVEVGTDLSLAKIYLRAIAGTRDEKQKLEVEKAANRAAAVLRRGLGPRLGIKKTPELSFFYDTAQDAVDRIEALLGEIERDNSSRS
jgi:ribosome-binding factor A